MTKNNTNKQSKRHLSNESLAQVSAGGLGIDGRGDYWDRRRLFIRPVKQSNVLKFGA